LKLKRLNRKRLNQTINPKKMKIKKKLRFNSNLYKEPKTAKRKSKNKVSNNKNNLNNKSNNNNNNQRRKLIQRCPE